MQTFNLDPHIRNEEGPKGKSKNLNITAADLIHVASAVGLSSRDGNPVKENVIRELERKEGVEDEPFRSKCKCNNVKCLEKHVDGCPRNGAIEQGVALSNTDLEQGSEIEIGNNGFDCYRKVTTGQGFALGKTDSDQRREVEKINSIEVFSHEMAIEQGFAHSNIDRGQGSKVDIDKGDIDIGCRIYNDIGK